MNESSKNETKHSFALTPAVLTFFFFECLFALQAFFAYHDHFFTVAQMRERGIDQGLPFVWHFGMWGDCFIVSPLAAYVIGQYSDRWRLRGILISLAFGFMLALIFSWLYTLSDVPEAHVQNHHLTAAGKVHLFYMAIALAVFIQFFLFSGNVSVSFLRIASVLLFIHVFLGTHMALGIIKLKFMLNWYPAQPLESRFGWITLWAVGFGLTWRNFGLRAALYPINQRARTSEEYLKFLDYLCKNITIWYFVTMLGLAWSRGENILSVILIALIGVVYHLSRLSVWQELEIGKTLFPHEPQRIPDRLQLKDRTAITLEVTLFMSLYLALAWVAHCILVASFCMFVIACIDLNTRRLINKNVREDFANPRYAPSPNEPGYQAMMDRRAIAEWYLFHLPHLWKEAGRIAGCAVAFGIANYAYFANAHDVTFLAYLADAAYCAANGYPRGAGNLAVLAYIILIVTLVANEALTMWWRVNRDHKFGRL
jgi:hypothetical protein